MRRLETVVETDPHDGRVMVHIAPYPGADAVTLCGITDWCKRPRGVPSRRTPDCPQCLAIARYCQELPRLVPSGRPKESP